MGTPLVTRGVQRRDGAQSPRAHQREIGRRRMKGVAAVEFALVVPFLLVVLFGIIDFGFMLYDKAMLTNAAREGARAGIVLRETPMSLSDVQDRAVAYCQNRMIRLGGGGSEDCTAQATRTGTTSLQDRLTVSVDYTYDGPIVNLIGLIGGSLELGTMRSTAVMVYE